jgi:hypothetical protein
MILYYQSVLDAPPTLIIKAVIIKHLTSCKLTLVVVKDWNPLLIFSLFIVLSRDISCLWKFSVSDLVVEDGIIISLFNVLSV